MQEMLKVTIQFERSDNPALYDALVRVPKGRRRTVRLITLAVLGLGSETSLASSTRPKDRNAPALSKRTTTTSAAAFDLFAPTPDGE